MRKTTKTPKNPPAQPGELVLFPGVPVQDLPEGDDWTRLYTAYVRLFRMGAFGEEFIRQFQNLIRYRIGPQFVRTLPPEQLARLMVMFNENATPRGLELELEHAEKAVCYVQANRAYEAQKAARKAAKPGGAQ